MGLVTKPRKLVANVKGAPFRIGDIVKVVYATDDTFNPYYMNHIGTIVHFDYSCGCGQTFPDDPMIGVKFVRKIEEFWKEELKLLSRPPRNMWQLERNDFY